MPIEGLASTRTSAVRRIHQSWFVLLLSALISAFGVPIVRAGDPPDEKLDCRVYETRQGSITLGLKAGNFLLSVGPEVTFGLKSGMTWERAAQGIIARYVEVCNRYNAGMLTKGEYESRLREIDGLYREAQELEAKLFEATRKRADAASRELDEALGRRPAEASTETVSLDESVQRLSDRIEQLEPIGRPLNPKPPCPPPDMLGAPGRSC